MREKGVERGRRVSNKSNGIGDQSKSFLVLRDSKYDVSSARKSIFVDSN